MGGSNSKKTKPVEAPRGGPYAEGRFHSKYSVGKELGHGAFSTVKASTLRSTGVVSAVKIINTKKISDLDMESLRMEIKILSELDHPHIIKLHEVYDESNEMYIVTELVSGGELFDRIVSKTYYTEKEARDLIKIFLETMNYLHQKGIVHRDIKPENLLLRSDDDDADIKLADFGFAKSVSELTATEEACGTPNYVAPEILRGDSYGCEVDVWSMGVVCYILLAGYAPFYEDDQKKLFDKIKKGKYHFHDDYWSRISPEAIDLIRKMMTVDQKKRWTSAQLLRHPWIVADDKVLASKDISGSVAELKRTMARRRLRAAANAVIMANRMQNLIGAITKGAKLSAQEDAAGAAQTE
jgi:serine/threonine protein kinase